MPEVNEHVLRISAGYIALEHPLTIGEDVKIKVEGTVTQITEKDLQNGEVDKVYTVKGIIAEVLHD